MEAAPSNPTHHPIATANPSSATANPSSTTAINMSTTAINRRNPLRMDWPTIDGPLGLTEQDSVNYARRYFQFGFFLLPWLWALNCFYFWPVLRRPGSQFDPDLRRYVVGSSIGFMVFTVILSTWALTFSIGGEHLFGHAWDQLVMYNVAEKYGLTGWI